MYGDIAVGASFRFVATTIEDVKSVRTGMLLVQSSYNSLLPPYIHMGVGRSNNYLESMAAGISIDNTF